MKKFVYSILASITLMFCFQNLAWSETYSFQRSIVFFASGEPTIDSSRGDATLQGTLTVDGATLSQDVTICLNMTNPPTCTSSGKISSQIVSVGENNRSASIMQQDGSVEELILLSLNPLITVFNGGNFLEINLWVLTDPLSTTSSQIVENDGSEIFYFPGNGKIGSSMIDALHAFELIQSP